jgi:hypothetical protein
MDYEIYAPAITTQKVVDPYNNPAGLKYVSNSSLAYYGGKYWAGMDGSIAGTVEGTSDQQLWLTTSTDGTTWSAPVQPFRNATYCNNPVSGSTVEWAPEFVVVGSELWCLWLGGTSAFLSKLTSPTGKWTNYRFEFIGSNQVFLSSTISGAATAGRSLRLTVSGVSDYYCFPTQNPIVLSSGVVACPVVFRSESVAMSSQTTAVSEFIRAKKFAAILKSTDGVSWSMTAIDSTSFGDFCPWEPYVVENAAGHVHVFIRNINTLAADPDMQLVARSLDGGNTFAPATSTKMLVPSSRGFARRITPSRWLLTHADHRQDSDQTPNQGFGTHGRTNGALFFSRRGVDDFIPGVNFSGVDSSMNYPQHIVGPDNKLHINYTSGTGGLIRRSLRVVTVDLPDDTKAYVHPRSVAKFTGVTDPALVSGTPPYYEFNGNNKALAAADLGSPTGLTYAAWLNWESEGDVIMDSRGPTDYGQIFTLRGLTIRSDNLTHGFTLTPGVPTFLAATINDSTDTVTFYACQGGTSFQTNSAGYAGLTLDGDRVSVGRKAQESSSLFPYAGRIYEARVYTSVLTAANLTSLNNNLADDFGYPAVTGTSTAPGTPLIFLNPASPNPTDFPSLGAAAYCETVSPTLLRIHGEESAGLELPYGATDVAIRYKLGAAPTSTDKYVIATFGTVDSPVRLYIDAANPTSLYANGRFVSSVPTPTSFNTVTVRVSTNKINIGSFEQYFPGKPRCFLGSAFPESLLAVTKTVDFDVAAMTATKASH